MSTLVIPRRGFLVGLGAALVAAPAIVRASSLMAVRPVEEIVFLGGDDALDIITVDISAWWAEISAAYHIPTRYLRGL